MRNLKKVLLSLGAVAAVAALATGGTFAVFTDQESIAGNDIDSGSVEIDLNDGSTDEVVSVTDMAIGDSKDGSLKVENDGANKANFDVTGDWTGDEALEGALRITVTQGATPVVTNVPLNTFNDGTGFDVGDLTPTGPGESKTYTIDISLPTGANDNALQNLAGSITFTADAVQRPGVDRNDPGDPEASF